MAGLRECNGAAGARCRVGAIPGGGRDAGAAVNDGDVGGDSDNDDDDGNSSAGEAHATIRRMDDGQDADEDVSDRGPWCCRRSASPSATLAS